MIKNKVCSVFLILALLLPYVGPDSSVSGAKIAADFQTYVAIEEVADATVRSWDSTTNFGSEDYLELSYSETGRSAILLRFDTSSIPSTAVIDSANMRLFLDGATGANTVSIGAYFITSSWDESTVTWNSDIRTEEIALNGDIDSVFGSYKSWYIPWYVQTWINDPSSNNGVLLLGPDSGDYYERWFESHDHNENVPQLEITYHVPVLSGRVYEGDVGNETTPIAGVNLSLHCSNNAGVLGTQIDTTTTDATGWYGLDVSEICEYYQIIEIDPENYSSVGATSVDGNIVESNWIEYIGPLDGKTLTGNKFWDRVPENVLHIISGPTVSNINPTSVVISWQTNEAADSLVQFDTHARLFRSEAWSSSQTTDHGLGLGELLPSTTYHFKVKSSDLSGNVVESDDLIFETLPVNDTRNPTVNIVDPGVIKDTVVFTADADDDMGVKKVEFFWNGEKVLTDFSFPYEWWFATGPEDNGDHDLMVKVFDLSGRSEIDTKTVKVLNFIDKEAPRVNIFNPNDGTDVYGVTSVWVTVSDDSGWSDVELFVDGIKVSGGSYPVSPSLDIKFNWDTTVLSQKTYSLAVKATDSDGKIGTDAIKVTVANPTPPPQPNLVITKHEVFRHGHTFAIELTVENQGNAKASKIEILDSLTGFQAIAGFSNGIDYRSRYVLNSRRTDITIDDSIGLAAGSLRTYIFKAVPILMHDNPPMPAIGNIIEMSYSGPTGINYKKPNFAFEVFKTTQTAGSAPSETLAQAHAYAIKTSHYLIVTNPNMLSFHNPFQDENQVLSNMAELAFRGEGILGFLSGSKPDEMLDTLVEPGGDWANSLHSNFGKQGLGYLLIVGETEIVPAWRESIPKVSWSNSTCVTYEVNLSDSQYADTGGDAAPELITGRIIGNDVLDLSLSLRNNLTGNFDRSHYLFVSGTDNNNKIQDKFVASIDEISKLVDCETCVTKLHMKDIDIGDQETAYKNNTADKDVIVYQGHGGVDSWHSLSTDQILSIADPLSFGNANPVVIGSACLTGSYEDHVSNSPCTKAGGDDNLAEAFIDQGAAVYVGSTEVSSINHNRSFVKAFFEKWWTLDTSVGKALTDLKRGVWSSNSYTQLWVYEYNLYGDPKYGVAPGGIPSTQALSVGIEQDFRDTEILSEIHMIIPDFEVHPIGDYHEVEIPGGEVLLEPGGYRIPLYSKTITYPPGYEIQQVSMTDRSGLEPHLNSGLNIPINEMFIDLADNQDKVTTRAADGWVPDDQFSWHVMEDPDGTITLTILMFPFYYDPVTTDILFYKNYSFDIDHIISPVTLTALTTNKEAYLQGALVQAEVMIANSGPALGVSVEPVIKKYPTGEFVVGLPLETLNSLVGDASVSLNWNTGGIEPGSYMLEVTLKNAENQVLDRITTTFQIGITSGQIQELDVTPENFEIGDIINALLRFKNTGSVDLSGTLHLKVYDPLGGLVKDYEKSFTDLAPGEILNHNAAWDSSGAERGDYGIVGYALYAGKSSEAKQIMISTKLQDFYYLPLIFKD